MCHFLKKEISLTYCEVFLTRRGESSPIKDYFLFLLLRNFSIGCCDAPKSTSEPGASGPLDVSRDNFRKSSGCISIMRSCLDAKLFAVFRHQPCAMSVLRQTFCRHVNSTSSLLNLSRPICKTDAIAVPSSLGVTV